VRTAVFKSANALVGWLLQKAADRADARYQPKAGQTRKGRESLGVQGIFGCFPLERDYYYDEGKDQGHYPADAALGLEVGYTPALAKLICLEGADETTYLKAERHLEQTGAITVSARQIQRVVQRVGGSAQGWQQRQRQPGPCDAPILYVSADGTGVPMVAPELKGRRGKQADGTAKTRQVYLGCVFTQHRTDEQGHPVRDYESTTYVSSFQSIDEFGPLLRQEAMGRGLATPARWCCSLTARRVWKTWAGSALRAVCKSWTFTTPWNTPARCWKRCWARRIRIIRSGCAVGPNGCSKTKSRL
jgi:hypothetical protein